MGRIRDADTTFLIVSPLAGGCDIASYSLVEFAYALLDCGGYCGSIIYTYTPHTTRTHIHSLSLFSPLLFLCLSLPLCTAAIVFEVIEPLIYRFSSAIYRPSCVQIGSRISTGDVFFEGIEAPQNHTPTAPRGIK